MSIFDSPIGRCEARKVMVLLDQCQYECAHEHGCPPELKCPFAGYFAEVSGQGENHAEAMDLAAQCLLRAQQASRSCEPA